MKCPKCHSDSIVKDNWYRSQAVRCYQCGWWSEKAPADVMPMRKDLITPSRPSNFQKHAMRPCPVEGCGGTMRLDSPRTMCNACTRLMTDWARGAKTMLPPVLEVDGKLYRRGLVNVEVAA